MPPQPWLHWWQSFKHTTMRAMNRKRDTERLALELGLRNSLIFIHAALGIEVGLAMLLTGGPVVLEAGPHGAMWRILLAGQAILPGLVTLYGLIRTEDTRDGWAAQFAGMLGLLVWSLCLVYIYSYSLTQTPLDFPGLRQPMDNPATGRLWIPLAYASVALLQGTHATILWRIGPPDRKKDHA